MNYIEKNNQFDRLGPRQFLSYSVGHLVNDLTAACWFNYLLVFLNLVVGTEAAPYALLAGQLADALSTPLLGRASDCSTTPCGKRLPWYLFGLLIVILSFLPIFTNFRLIFPEAGIGLEYAYYIFFSSLFNVGWAAIQVNHMSLVPSLSCSRSRRDTLNSLRNLFGSVANFAVLLTGFIVFGNGDNPSAQFQTLAFAVLLVGTLASVVFMLGIQEQEHTDFVSQKRREIRRLLLTEEGRPDIRWSQWFCMASFYKVGLSYTCARLFINVFGAMLPFYLLATGYADSSGRDIVNRRLASIPLINYSCSVIASLGLPWLYSRLGRKPVALLGAALVVAGSGLVLWGKSPVLVAVLVGPSQTFILSTSINMISEVVGSRGDQGAFVFGVYSLCDKLLSGVVIFLLSSRFLQKEGLRLLLGLLPAVLALLAVAGILSQFVQEYKEAGDEQFELTQQFVD